MKKQDAFNHLMEKGFSYEHYLTRSNRHADKYPRIWDTATEEIEKLPTEFIEKLNKHIKVLVIGENWCSDCVKGIPVIARLAKTMTNWEFKIMGKDDIENEEILDHYTTAGRVKIPVVIFADEDGDEVARFVERPRRSYKILAKLQEMRLPKEEYIARYKNTPELQLEETARETLRELVELSEYVTTILSILPKKKNVKKTA